MIGVAGIARAGKDTLANDLSEIIKADMGVDVRIYSLAYPIRCQIANLLEDYYHISPFTEDSDEKLIIRPLLVAHGEQMKKQWGEDVWLKELMTKIEEDRHGDKKIFPIISDVRFDFELKSIKDQDGQVIHISKIGNTPPNNTEAKNDPIVANASDIRHSWPPCEPDEMHECKAHAEILWQMLKETHLDIWKKIYI